MIPFKALFFYPITDSIELVIVADKDGNVKHKICSTKIISNKKLDMLERIFEEVDK